MSICYGIVCIDCGEAYPLGKSHYVTSEFHENTSYGFSNLDNVIRSDPEKPKNFIVGLQHFLILHRQHELRVLPDDSATVQDAWYWFDFSDGDEGDLHHLLSVPVKPPEPGHQPDREEPLDGQMLQRLETNSKRAIERYLGKWKRK